MKQPDFWLNPPTRPGWQARLLAPVAAVVARASARRVARPDAYRTGVPVICIGNINVGGTGKTPTTIALAERLRGAGHAVHVVSRGHGGSQIGPTRVDEAKHSAFDVGDEPLLLSAFAPTWIARDRSAGVKAAESAGAQVILLDDGFQNPSVKKDLSIVVVDAARGFGNGRVMPAGPLRENLAAGLSRADLVLSIGPHRQQTSFTELWGGKLASPHLTAALHPLATGMDWAGLRVFAFAGIGHPEKFFATLRATGADLIRADALDDHQPLTDKLMARLQQDALAKNAQLVTTEKDAVRLPRAFRQDVLTLPVRLKFDAPERLDAALRSVFSNHA